MPAPQTLLVFTALSFGVAATPWPNVLHLISHALARGTGAELVSLVGRPLNALEVAT